MRDFDSRDSFYYYSLYCAGPQKATTDSRWRLSRRQQQLLLQHVSLVSLR